MCTVKHEMTAVDSEVRVLYHDEWQGPPIGQLRTDGSALGHNDKTLVDVLSLEDFQATLDARMTEAQSIMTSLVDGLAGRMPELGGLIDAGYVSGRYGNLQDEHVDRVSRLILAIAAAQAAMATMITNYQTVEALLAANAADIGELLDGVSGALTGEPSDAR